MRRPLIIVLSGVAIAIVALMYVGPAFKSEASIKASLLAQMPVGSSVDEVRELAQKHGLEFSPANPNSFIVFLPGTTGVLVSAYSGLVSHDPFPYRSVVQATWMFDESNRLVEIIVHRPGHE
jgi:hypothetical protein